MTTSVAEIRCGRGASIADKGRQAEAR